MVAFLGRTDPIRLDYKADSLGVGKAEEEQSYHVSSTAKRKTMDSEKMLEESQAERAYRESKAEKQQAIHKEIKDVTRAFYCELCDKQYSKVIDYEKHLQSYDHHHKKVSSSCCLSDHRLNRAYRGSKT